MNRMIVAALVLASLSAGASAQEQLVDQTKLYVTDPSACSVLQSRGVAAFEDLYFLRLSFVDGIDGMEFHCGFFDIKSARNTANLFVSAVCELPGEIYPDTLSISPYDETTIQVVSNNEALLMSVGALEASDDISTTGATLYHRCDNLSELPR